jgi:O-antigen/teichoic acid export membrane protein
LLPHLLPLEDLATYGVLAAIAGSLFRVLQMGVGYSLLPRLRAAPGVRERRRLLFKEARLVVAVATTGSLFIWVATPQIEHWFLGGKYHLSAALVLAAVVTGFAKVLNGFAQSAVSALAEPRELHLVAVLGWVSVLVAALGAVAGARWGLPGVIYGVGLGWVMRASVGMVLSARHLRVPVTAHAVPS